MLLALKTPRHTVDIYRASHLDISAYDEYDDTICCLTHYSEHMYVHSGGLSAFVAWRGFARKKFSLIKKKKRFRADKIAFNFVPCA